MKLKTVRQSKNQSSTAPRFSEKNQAPKKVLGMGRHHIRAIKQYILVVLLTIGGSIAALVASGYEGPLIKKLSIVFLIVLGFFAGLSAIDLVGQSDTAPDASEVEQGAVNTAPESVDSGQESSLTGEELLQIRELIARPDDNLYFVDEVIDGDTIKVDGDIKVRLIGIDAPESGKCYYEEARNELVRLVQGEYVRMERDTESVDGLGRLLRYVYLPGKDLMENDIFVNRHLLLYGYARTFSLPPNKLYFSSFVKAREQALIQRKGLWSDECDYRSEFEQEHALTREINELPTDPNCIIKGNISSRGAGKLYFPPGCSSYNQIKIDTSKGEQYFCTEEQAIAAGFKKSGNCP